MSITSFENILEELSQRDPEAAWDLFLDEYSTTIFQVVRHIEHDSNLVPDCFQFVCEKLSADSFRRLRKFRPGGRASFSTWLRAVVRNLCLDWHRKQFGRHRTFKSISRLSGFDQQVFRLLYEQRVSFDEALQTLRSTFPDVSHARLLESKERIEKELTVNQRRLLDVRASHQANRNPISADETATASAGLADPALNPEARVVLSERSAALRRALAHLPPAERLLILLRFEQELTLEQLGRTLQLGNAQRVERQLKSVLSKLREELEVYEPLRGKTTRLSVKE